MSQAWFERQFVETVHPQFPLTQPEPTGFPVQLTQAPELPQTVGSWPVTHTPWLQQPPSHGLESLQAEVHRLVAVLQVPSVHEEFTVQPQFPPPEAAMHSFPALDPTQPMHKPPVLPHCAAAVPATQVPPSIANEQHPSLQGELAEQAVVHVCELRSHARPILQPVVESQPQTPAMHDLPRTLVPQLTHALPLDPQCDGPAARQPASEQHP